MKAAWRNMINGVGAAIAAVAHTAIAAAMAQSERVFGPIGGIA